MTDPNNKTPKEKDPVTGIETTGHEWDGLKELNNPAPRWWLMVFVITVVFSIGYWVLYPAWPTLTGATKGLLGWTQHRQLAERRADILAVRERLTQRIAGASLEQIHDDPEMYAFARAGGEAAFKDNCAACHGTGATGGRGYPNLNDDDWLHGGTLQDIYTTIRHGVRSGHAEAKGIQMPAFGRDGLLTAAEIEDVAQYVTRLHEGESVAAADDKGRHGKALFAANCAVCHGATGGGDMKQGVPRLNDAIWLYGGDLPTVTATITNARAGVMPSWEGRLDDATIKELTLYVHELGGGQ